MHLFQLRWHRSIVFVCASLVLVRFLTSCTFALVLPALESYDEPAHYAYVRFMVVHGRAPYPDESFFDDYERHQPPLYYAIVSKLIGWVDVSDDARPEFLWANVVAVKPDITINGEGWHFQQTALAIRAARVATAAVGALTTLCTFFSTFWLFAHRRKLAVLAMAIHVFWPLSVWMSGVISNDNGVAWCGSLALLSCAGAVKATRTRWFLLALIGTAFAIVGALLMKDTGIGVVIPSLIVMGGLFVRSVRFNRKQLWVWVVFSVALVFGGFGAYSASQGRALRQVNTAILLLTDFLHLPAENSISSNPQSAELTTNTVPAEIMAALAPQHPTSGVKSWLNGLPKLNLVNFFDTFFGVFGRGSIHLPQSWYNAAYFFVVASILALLLSLSQRAIRRPVLLCLWFFGWAVLAPIGRALAFEAYWTLMGRFVLVGITPFAIAVAASWFWMDKFVMLTSQWMQVAIRIMRGGLLCGLAWVSVFAPLLVVQPLYSHSPIYAAKLGDTLAIHKLNFKYADEIELIGYLLPKSRSARAQEINVTLYFRALKPMSQRYKLWLEVFGTDGKSFGAQILVEPAAGTFPTTVWKPDEVYAQSFYLNIFEHVDAPTVAQFKLSWVDEKNIALPVQCPAMPTPCDPKFAQVPIELDAGTAKRLLNESSMMYGKFNNQLGLLAANVPQSAQAGGTVPITLTWAGLENNLPNATLFVHLLSADGKLIAQSDAPARSGLYPTLLWRKGEIVPDVMQVALPNDMIPGDYELVLGAYDSATLQRFDATDWRNQPLLNNVIHLAVLKITAP